MMNKDLSGFPSTRLPLPSALRKCKLVITSTPPLGTLFSSMYQNVQPSSGYARPISKQLPPIDDT